MTCFHPLIAYGYLGSNGFVEEQLSFKENDGEKLYLPCRHCIGCKVSARALKSLLFKMELHTHEMYCGTGGSFITLTYNKDNLPPSGLAYADLEEFMRALKKFLKRQGFNNKIDYVYSGEYGLLNFRPHFHICCLGVNPLEFNYIFKESVYALNKHQSSPLVNRLWHKGFNTVLPLNTETACYTLGYTVKKMLIVGDTYELERNSIFNRRKRAGFKGLCREGTNRTARQSFKQGITEKEYVRKTNKLLTERISEFIDFKGRKIENPAFPKGRCFTYQNNKYYACERTGSSASLGNKFYNLYKDEFLTGFIHDPVDPKKIYSIPQKFLTKLKDTDFSRYVKIKQNKAHIAKITQEMIDNTSNYFVNNENALKLRLKGNSIRPLDMEMLDEKEEEEIERLIFEENCF